jgi:hypothetical protein
MAPRIRTGIPKQKPGSFKDLYTAGDPKKLEALMGELAPLYMEQRWSFTIKSELIPPEKAPAYVAAVQKITADMAFPLLWRSNRGLCPGRASPSAVTSSTSS